MPQTFTFAPSESARTATLSTLAGSVKGPDLSGFRGSILQLTFDVGDSVEVANIWQSNQGLEFDSEKSPITIPAGASSLTVQALSAVTGGATSPASFAWVGAALSITNPTPPPPPPPPPPAGGETATGYGTKYCCTDNWFMYSKYGTSKIDLVTGRTLQDIGDIYMSKSGSGSSVRTTIRITLIAGWSWDSVEGVLKINPFSSEPRRYYLEPGQFLYHFTAPNIAKTAGTTAVFAGQTATVTMTGKVGSYGIPADVANR